VFAKVGIDVAAIPIPYGKQTPLERGYAATSAQLMMMGKSGLILHRRLPGLLCRASDDNAGAARVDHFRIWSNESRTANQLRPRVPEVTETHCAGRRDKVSFPEHFGRPCPVRLSSRSDAWPAFEKL
jgi:hypothetical protein